MKRCVKNIQIFIQSLIILSLIHWFISASVYAQDVEEIADAILQLPRTFIGNQQVVDGQLYSGKIDAIITDEDGNLRNFETGDLINFRITSKRGGKTLTFRGTRVGFDDFVEKRAGELLEILFPTSLPESVTGNDTVQNHSQELLSKVLEGKLGQSQIGGLAEYEWFKIDDIDGRAFQGLFYIDRLFSAIEWRYATLDDDIDTKSVTIGLDLYPHYETGSESLTWSIGLDGFTTLLYAPSDAFNLGVFDSGGGIWTSFRKDSSRIRIGLGVVFQASKTYIPSSMTPDEIDFLAEEINNRDLDLNLTYGTILGVLLTERLSLNAKLYRTHSFTHTGDIDSTSQTILLISPSYVFGDIAPVDLGYKREIGLEGITSNSIFLRGNYRW